MTHERLKQILTKRLRLITPQFDLEGKGRVSGSVVSSTFDGLGDSERQKLIWDALDAELGPSSVREVGMLLAYTPDEWGLQLEGHLDVPRKTAAPRRPATHRKAG